MQHDGLNGADNVKQRVEVKHPMEGLGDNRYGVYDRCEPKPKSQKNSEKMAYITEEYVQGG